jgi:hypothetical protein
MQAVHPVRNRVPVPRVEIEAVVMIAVPVALVNLVLEASLIIRFSIFAVSPAWLPEVVVSRSA